MNAARLALVMGLLLLKLAATAQLCTGSLGDPIVNITFGAGTNPGPPLSAAATGYNYLDTDCPNDGQYAVRSSTSNCFTTWHSLTQDHTGNPGGYFMLVNASFQPSAFYVDTVNLQCSNTVYEFAAWALNMIRNAACRNNANILPNLSFSVEKPDGTVLKTYNTGDIPIAATVDWRQYGFFFAAPPGVNKIVLRIYNNAPGGCGNDLALDDITFRPCGPQVTAAIVNNSNNSTVNFCQGSATPISLSSTVSAGFTDAVLQWQQSTDSGKTWIDVPGAIDATFTPNFSASTAAASYRYRLAVAKKENGAIALCRVYSGILTVNINPLPAPKIMGKTTICRNSTLSLQTSGTENFSWQGPDGFSATSNVVSITDAQEKHSGKYVVTATSAAGCSVKDSVIATINPRPDAGVSPTEASICEGETIALSGMGGDDFLWSPAAGLSATKIAAPTAAPLTTTRYAVTVANAFGCTDTAYAQVTVLAKPKADAGPDIQLLKGQSVVLSATARGTNISYTWRPDIAITNSTTLQPEVAPQQSTAYVLTVTSAVGCGTATDTVNVTVLKDIFIPTAFTPDGDGINDVWRPAGLQLFADKEVRVFNRYGQVVFLSRSNSVWNGNFKGVEQPAGIYTYIIKVKKLNLLLKGWVMLVR